MNFDLTELDKAAEQTAVEALENTPFWTAVAKGGMRMSENDCPNKKNHTRCPRGYSPWHEWAFEKSRRHKQIRCPGCGLLTIWVRRDKGEPDYGGDEWMLEMAGLKKF